MNKYFNDTINITNKYIVLATPLILFSLISNIYLVISASGKLINLLIGIVLLFLMTSAFLAGWFTMVKDAVNEENDNNPNAIIKNFVSGVGEYFLSTLGGIFNILIIFSILSVLTYLVGAKFIGDPAIDPVALKNAFTNTALLKDFLTTLNPEQIQKLAHWNFLMFANLTTFYFIIMFYFPSIFYKSKNPFMAFFISLKDLFSKKFFKSLALFFIIEILYFVLTLLITLFGGNIVMHFILTLLHFYFVTAISVAIFNYYNKNFVMSQIGQNVDITL